jgi:hypothetical protein
MGIEVKYAGGPKTAYPAYMYMQTTDPERSIAFAAWKQGIEYEVKRGEATEKIEKEKPGEEIYIKETKETIIPYGYKEKEDTKAPGVGKQGKWGAGGLVCIAVVVALGYLILGNKKK